MNKSAPNGFPKTHTTHSVLIGAPLIIVLAFAFGFVLLQPVNSANSRLASASQPASSKTAAAKASSNDSFVPAQLPETSLPTLPNVPANSDTTGNALTGDTSPANQPQAAGSSSASAPSSPNGLQSTVPNTQSNTSKPLNTKASSPPSSACLFVGNVKVCL